MGVAFCFVLASLAQAETGAPVSKVWANDNLEVRITTEKPHYYVGQTVRIKINNQSEQKTFVWLGPCSLVLEHYNGNAWKEGPTAWSGCPLCGIQREIPEPLFLSPGATKEIKWDQIVTWCEEGTTKIAPALGRFRFVFRYAEDEPKCHLNSDPFKCWLLYRDKKWQSANSNEFTIKEHGDL